MNFSAAGGGSSIRLKHADVGPSANKADLKNYVKVNFGASTPG